MSYLAAALLCAGLAGLFLGAILLIRRSRKPKSHWASPHPRRRSTD